MQRAQLKKGMVVTIEFSTTTTGPNGKKTEVRQPDRPCRGRRLHRRSGRDPLCGDKEGRQTSVRGPRGTPGPLQVAGCLLGSG